MGAVALREHRTLCKKFLEPSLQLQVQFHKHDNLLAMVNGNGKVHGGLAELETLKPQEIKFMKLYQGLNAEDRLYDLITEIDPRW